MVYFIGPPMNDNSFSYKDIKYDWNHQVFSQFDDKLILSFSKSLFQIILNSRYTW